MKLLPFPTREERQAMTPYHSIDIGGAPDYTCKITGCPTPADGMVEVPLEINNLEVGPVKIAVCEWHFHKYWKSVEK